MDRAVGYGQPARAAGMAWLAVASRPWPHVGSGRWAPSLSHASVAALPMWSWQFEQSRDGDGSIPNGHGPGKSITLKAWRRGATEGDQLRARRTRYDEDPRIVLEVRVKLSLEEVQLLEALSDAPRHHLDLEPKHRVLVARLWRARFVKLRTDDTWLLSPKGQMLLDGGGVIQ